MRDIRPVALRALLLAVGVAGYLLAAPTAHAQETAKVVRIGWLSTAIVSASTGGSTFDALRSGHVALGYAEGRNIVFEKRWANGVTARIPALAADLVRLKVDVICTAGTPASLAAKGATTAIPIVFANVAFPTDSGLVASHAHLQPRLIRHVRPPNTA